MFLLTFCDDLRPPLVFLISSDLCNIAAFTDVRRHAENRATSSRTLGTNWIIDDLLMEGDCGRGFAAMAMLFGPLNSDGRTRSLLYRAARLSMLHDRMLMRFDKVDDAADKVQAAAELFAEAARPVGSTQTLAFHGRLPQIGTEGTVSWLTTRKSVEGTYAPLSRSHPHA